MEDLERSVLRDREKRKREIRQEKEREGMTMKVLQLVLVLLLVIGIVSCAAALTQEEAEQIITSAEDEWNDAYAARDWDYFESDLYCPDAVIIPYEGSKIFLPVEEAPAIWNASWYPPDTYTDAILAVTVIPAVAIGAENPMILVVGETTSPTAEFEVENWSEVYAICDDSGEYKILVRRYARTRHAS